MSAPVIAVWVAVALLVVIALWVYVTHVAANLKIANNAIGTFDVVASAQGVVAKLDARLTGWKTVILAWIAAVAQLFSFITTDTVAAWKDLPWAQVFDAKVANWITFGCAALIPIVHARGLARAATTTPVDQG